jgi:hypothetical protein
MGRMSREDYDDGEEGIGEYSGIVYVVGLWFGDGLGLGGRSGFDGGFIDDDEEVAK